MCEDELSNNLSGIGTSSSSGIAASSVGVISSNVSTAPSISSSELHRSHHGTSHYVQQQHNGESFKTPAFKYIQAHYGKVDARCSYFKFNTISIYLFNLFLS